MKSKLLTTISMAISLSLVIGASVLPVQAKYAGKSATYSNLYDKSTQNKTAKQMEQAGILKKNCSTFFNYVKEYNKDMSPIPLAKKGYCPLKGSQPGYDDGKALERWLASSQASISDINCRITAFGLLKDKISSSGKSQGNGKTIAVDLDTILNYPVKEFSRKDTITFKNLYADIKIGPLQSPYESAKAVRKYWKKQKINFQTGKNISLISVFQYFDLDQTVFVGHTGVLIHTGNEYLFLEKYGPSLPYQATKFSRKSDLYYYLMNRLDVGDGAYSTGAFIMENSRLMDPGSFVQQINTTGPQGGALQKQDTQLKYTLSKRGDVTVSFYTAAGKLAARYKESSISPSQEHVFTWGNTVTGQNQLNLKNGTSIPKGRYFAKISSEGKTVKTVSFKIR